MVTATGFRSRPSSCPKLSRGTSWSLPIRWTATSPSGHAGRGRQIVLLDVAEADLDAVQLVRGQLFADGDRFPRGVGLGRLVRGPDQGDDADDGGQDEQDADEEPGIFPRRLLQPRPAGHRAHTHAPAPPVVAARHRPGIIIVTPSRPDGKASGTKKCKLWITASDGAIGGKMELCPDS